MSESNQSLEEFLFEAALAKSSAGERAAFLDGVCRENPGLRARLEVLLEGHFQAEGFLAAGPKTGEEKSAPAPADAEAASSFIGRYKLLEKIGEGGFGEVWMAEQREPVKRRVALKIVKLGMDTKQVVARFEAERQALALMEHPNIAKVLDAGATDTGRPYFVMEFVRGVRVTEYCDRNVLSTQERLKLFIQVCRAIQHAHQKGIIHRDIKPSNILVTLHDSMPVPKVIDFGIAKATQMELTGKTVFTQFHQFLGTPAYVSPEQAEMSGLDIDTRSDIYSLGVLLYELLTGTTPFDTQELVKAGLEGMCQIIRERQPPRPSTRLNRELAGYPAGSAAQSKIKNQNSKIPDDLDWIVMKCLEKDRARRYETANGLARDIERHLNNEPVVARPPSRLYAFQKTVRRHWVGFAAVAGILTVLVAGVIVSTLEALRARRAENRNKERLAESEAIFKFVVQAYQNPDPDRDGRTITVAEYVSNGVGKVETGLAGQPAQRAKVQENFGFTYYSLGLYAEAISLQEKVRDYYLSAYGLQAPETLQVMQELAQSYDRAGRWSKALKLHEEVLALRQKVNGPEHPDTIVAMMSLAIANARAGHLKDGVKKMEEVLALCRRLHGAEHPSTIKAMCAMAGMYAASGRPAESLSLLQGVVRLLCQVNGPDYSEALDALPELVMLYHRVGRLDESIHLINEVLELERKVRGPTHPVTLTTMQNLQLACFEAGRLEESVKLGEELVLLRRTGSGPQHPATQKAMENLAKSYCSVRRERDAMVLLATLWETNPGNSMAPLVLATLQAWFGPDADYQATRSRFVQQTEGTADRAAKAYCLAPSTDGAMLAKALALARKAVEMDKDNPWVRLGLGIAEYRNGLYADAEKTLTTAEQTAGPSRDIAGTARLYRALSILRQGRTGEAQRLFRQTQIQAQMPPFPKDESNPFADIKPKSQNHDLLIWWLAYKEAKGELQQPAAAKP